ncbi:unnamed protein product, partial [Brassica rapa]
LRPCLSQILNKILKFRCLVFSARRTINESGRLRSSPPSLIIIIRCVYRFWIRGVEAGACDNGLRIRSRLQRDVLRRRGFGV